MISTGQRLRGMAALVALLAVVVGVPWALVAVGGNPLPTSLSGSLLTEPLGADAILGVLIAVMWVAWAHFMVCLVIELRAHRRHRAGVTTAQGTSHPLVRRLVASIVLVASSAAVSATAAEAAQPVASHATFVSRVAADADALRQLADQAPEAHVAIAPKVGNDVQAKLGLRYIVQPPHSGNYDSLWAIAERLLGDGRRWREIYDLNKAVLQADGTSLQDADLIYPGWQLLLPDDATGNAVLGDRGNNNVNNKSDGRDQSSGRDGGSAPRQQSTQTAPQPATADVSSPAEDHTPITASVGGLVGLIIASAMLGLRRRGTVDVPQGGPGLGDNPPEGGPPGGGGGNDPELLRNTELVDRASRRLDKHFADAGAGAPRAMSARVSDRHFTIAFDSEPTVPAPSGWAAIGDGRSWTVEHDALDAVGSGMAAAYPRLTCVGTDGGDLVLADLTGLVGVRCDNDAVTNALLRGVAATASTQPWGDGLTVVTVGLSGLDALVPLTEGSLVLAGPDSLDEVLERAGERAMVVIGADPGGHAAVVATEWAADHGSTATVVGPSTDQSGLPATFELRSTGRLTSPSLGVFASAGALNGDDIVRMAFTVASMTAAAGEPGERRVRRPGAANTSGRPARVAVSVLGPVGLQVAEGHGSAPDTGRLALVQEVLLYLALQPDGAHTSVLAAAIWPRGVTPEVVAATLDHVRAYIGDPATGVTSDGASARVPGGMVLDMRDGRWHLDAAQVSVDWETFQELAGDRGDAEEALRLVSGPPLQGLPNDRYAWLRGSGLADRIATAVIAVAHDLAHYELGRDHLAAAEGALRAGLVAGPACESLWRELLGIAGREDRAAAVVDEMYETLQLSGSPRGAEAETDALVQALVPGYQVPGSRAALSA